MRTSYATPRSAMAMAWLLCSGVSLAQSVTAPARTYSNDDDAENAEDGPKLPESRLCVAEQVIYNDNVFLNNSALNVTRQLGPNASLTDTIFRTLVCGDAVLRPGAQVFKLSGTVADQRYLHNDQLNHTAAKVGLQWDWRTAYDWYGELGGDYQRALGSFLTDRPLQKDLVDSEQYRASINHDFGTYVTVGVGGQRDEVRHSASGRQVDDYRNNGFDGRFTLTSRAGNYVGVVVEHDTADFPNNALIGTTLVDRDYEEMTESVRLRYSRSDKLVFLGSAGNLEREYQRANQNDFSGAVWRGSVQWLPIRRLDFDLSAWKELSAYLDSQSDHFVGRGTGIKANWSASDRWQFMTGWRWAREQYITRSLLVAAVGPREDKVQTGSLAASYAREHLRIELQVQYEQRDSTLAVYDYHNCITSLQLIGEL